MRMIHPTGKFLSLLGAGTAALAIGACGGTQAPAPEAPPPPPPASVSPPPAVSSPAPAASAVPPPAAAAAVPPAPEQKPEHRCHHAALGMLLRETAEAGLRPDQQAVVAGIKADLAKLDDVGKDAVAQLKSDLADGVAAGKLNKNKIDADTKQLATAQESTIKTVQDSVNKLQKALDAEQRKKVVDQLQAKLEKMGEHGMTEMHGFGSGVDHHGPDAPGAGPHGPGGPGAGPHGSGGPGAGHHGSGGPGAGHHGSGGPGAGPQVPMAVLGDELGLAPDQREKLKTKLDALKKTHEAAMKNRHAEMRKQMKAMSDAFVTDKFDAKRAGVGAKHGDTVKMMVKHRVEFIEAVLTILTPEQRPKFAEHIRKFDGPGHS